MKKLNAPQKIGILGGGQLARMLALAAHPMGLVPYVLTEEQDDPAAQVTSFWVKGSPHKASDLKKFFNMVDLITFESEFIEATALAKISAATETPVHPSPQIMELIQDRLSQKSLLRKHGLATADFFEISEFHQAEHALSVFKEGMVLKQRRNGYDGYGTFIIKNKKQLLENRKTIENSECGFVAEKFIKFDRELAVMCARSTSGQIEFMPMVESLQKNSRCFWVKGPLKSTAIFLKMFDQLETFLTQTKYVGVLGVEFFETDKRIIINELAPRVHNTGHYSQNTFQESQFQWHLKCLLGQALAPAHCNGGFAMVNLLGRPTARPQWALPKDVSVHWYGKTMSKPGRKMGHINSLAENPEKALEQALQAIKVFKI